MSGFSRIFKFVRKRLKPSEDTNSIVTKNGEEMTHSDAKIDDTYFEDFRFETLSNFVDNSAHNSTLLSLPPISPNLEFTVFPKSMYAPVAPLATQEDLNFYEINNIPDNHDQIWFDPQPIYENFRETPDDFLNTQDYPSLEARTKVKDILGCSVSQLDPVWAIGLPRRSSTPNPNISEEKKKVLDFKKVFRSLTPTSSYATPTNTTEHLLFMEDSKTSQENKKLMQGETEKNTSQKKCDVFPLPDLGCGSGWYTKEAKEDLEERRKAYYESIGETCEPLEEYQGFSNVNYEYK